MKMNAVEQSYLEKAEQLCASAEQCTSSVRRKLADWGCPIEMMPKIVDKLVATGFVDESRYVKAYCESKAFSQKWGRIKIQSMLRQKHIGGELIAKAVKEIDDERYRAALREVAEEKWKTCQVADPMRSRGKLMAFLASRGYESEVVQEVVQDIINKK